MGVREIAVGAALTMGAITGLGSSSNPAPAYDWEQAGNVMQAEHDRLIDGTTELREACKEPDKIQLPL